MKQACQSCKKPFEPTACVLFDIAARCPKCRLVSASLYQTLGWKENKWTATEINSGLPNGFLALTPGAQTAGAERTVAQAFREQLGLHLVGDSGKGKTLTLAVLAKQLIRLGVPVAFINVPQFSAWLRANPDRQEEQRLRLMGVRHLILDDMGAEYDKTGWWGAWLLAVADARYGARRATSSSCNCVTGIETRVLRRVTEFALTVELQ